MLLRLCVDVHSCCDQRSIMMDEFVDEKRALEVLVSEKELNIRHPIFSHVKLMRN